MEDEDKKVSLLHHPHSKSFRRLTTNQNPSKTTMSGTKVDAGAIAAPFRAEVREKVEALKAKGIGKFRMFCKNQHKICRHGG